MDSIEAIGGPNNNDYLVKIQGKLDAENDRPNRNLRIRSISARNGPNSGLYVYYSEDVEVGSYRGENNGTSRPWNAKNGADVLIVHSDDIRFAELRAKGFPRYGLWLHDKTGQVSADRVEFMSALDASGDPIVIKSGKAMLGGIGYLPNI